VNRGEIWWLDFGVPIGSAPGYERPAVIVSADRFNNSGIMTVIVVGITSNLGLTTRPGNVFLAARDTGLDRDSVANVGQIAAVGRQILQHQIGAVPNSLMRDVDTGLRLALQL
jgi:mRNA interferase MazF